MKAKEVFSHRRSRLIAVGGLATALLAGGGAAAVAASSTPARSGSVSAPTAASTAARPAPPAKVHPPHLDGTVLTVSGTHITIKDPEGFTRTIITSTSTKYSDGLSASPAVGSTVHATGTVDADKISLDAAALGKRPAPPAGGPGRHGPAKPGDHPRPAPPTGSQAPGSSGSAGSGASSASPSPSPSSS